jgi:RNA 2',3'-cyclic 3'-phosphodiesterase
MARIRTFIAVDVDKTLRERMIALQDRLAASGVEVKWVEPDNLHFTLLFLGEVDERDLIDVCRAATQACKGLAPFYCDLEGVGCFPNERRPRIVWVGVGSGATEFGQLHDALEKPLLELGCYRREERLYTPHITLGRVKHEGENEALVKNLQKLKKWQGGQMQVREVLVMSSQLTSKGPVYAVMSRARLATE